MLLTTISKGPVSVTTRSGVADHILVFRVDSTAELPSEPYSGFAGSSSCVSICSRSMTARTKFIVLEAISNFD